MTTPQLLTTTPRSMRTTAMRAATAAAIVMTATFVPHAQENKADQIMSQVRKALGGEQKLTAVKALSLRATYQREMAMAAMTGGGRAMVTVQGGAPPGGDPQQATGDIEIDLELPGKYIKVDTSTGFMAMTRTEGFDGDRPFAHAASANPGMRIRIDNPADDPTRAKQALQRNQAELARLLLGILGSTQASFPVTYTYGGVAESPDGRADIVDVKGPDNFTARLFLDVRTHLPLMLTYSAREPRMVINTSARGHSNAEAERDNERRHEENTPPKMVEYRLFFADYRDVGGLSLPHRITRGTTEKTAEEWEIKSYKINPSFKADRFKVS